MGKHDFPFLFEMKDFDLLCRHVLIQHKAPSQVCLSARLDLKGVNISIITGFYKETLGIYHNLHLQFC